MGQIKADTDAIVASAAGLGRVSDGVSAGSSWVVSSGDAAAETPASGAYNALLSQCTRSVSQLGQAGDQMATAAGKAAECYIAADRLTN